MGQKLAVWMVKNLHHEMVSGTVCRNGLSWAEIASVLAVLGSALTLPLPMLIAPCRWDAMCEKGVCMKVILWL